MAIAVIPSEHFHWRARVQFQDSFRTREEALNFAFVHGYNLVVEHEDSKGLQYDVLLDPDGACTAGLNMELLESQEFLEEPEPGSWTRLMFATLIALARRFAAFTERHYRARVLPFARHQAFIARRRYSAWEPEVRRYVKIRWQLLALAIRRNWRTGSAWSADFARRSAAVAKHYLRQAGPLARRGVAVAHGYIMMRMVPIARRAAAAAGRYSRQIVPLCRRAIAATRPYLQQLGHLSRRAIAASGPYFRRMVSFGRRATAAAIVWLRGIAVRTANTVRREWPGIRSAVRRSCGNIHGDALRLGHKFCTAVAGLYQRKIAPRFRAVASRIRRPAAKAATQKPPEPELLPQHFNFFSANAEYLSLPPAAEFLALPPAFELSNEQASALSASGSALPN